MAHAADIVGYTFKADTYCPEHIEDAMTATEAYDGWKLAESVIMSTEDSLDEIATAFGIDRENEASFDNEKFPKVIFRDQADDSFCSVCGEILG